MSVWTDEKTAELLEVVGDARPVVQGVVAKAAEVLEVSTRSISAKLRKLGEEVEKAGPRARKFSDEQETALVQFLSDNAGQYTYAEIAGAFGAGKFTAKQIQGKVLSLELTDAVKPTPKPEVKKTYSDAEEATFIKLAKSGAFLEDIADALDRTIASVRGKALSLNRVDQLDSIPKQRESHAANKVDVIEDLYNSGELVNLTVNEIAEKSGKTPRGVRTIITRRGYEAVDYKAKAKKEAA